MARGPRPVAPSQPHHILHRGHNRQALFAEPENYARYLADLRWAKTLYACRLYAYVLMTNHVHLLLEPSDAGHLAQVMKRVAGRYTRYMNNKYRWTGTVWEGQFKSAVVDDERYLSAVSRYIELNPVRARMVTHPGAYVWSSYTIHARGAADGLVDLDPWYYGLGMDAPARGRAYVAWINEVIPLEEWARIRDAGLSVCEAGEWGAHPICLQTHGLVRPAGCDDWPPGRVDGGRDRGYLLLSDGSSGDAITDDGSDGASGVAGGVSAVWGAGQCE